MGKHIKINNLQPCNSYASRIARQVFLFCMKVQENGFYDVFWTLVSLLFTFSIELYYLGLILKVAEKYSFEHNKNKSNTESFKLN